jgi:hypothetical protein
MPSTADIFTASQFVIMKCIKNLSDINSNLEEIDPFSASSNITFLEDNIKTLSRLIEAMNLEEYGDDENSIDEEVEDILGEDTDEEESSDDSSEDSSVSSS